MGNVSWFLQNSVSIYIFDQHSFTHKNAIVRRRLVRHKAIWGIARWSTNADRRYLQPYPRLSIAGGGSIGRA